MRKRINALTIIGMIMVFTGLGHLVPTFLASPENRWTPRELAVGLDESADRVGVLVAGVALADHVKAGTLLVGAEGQPPRPLTPEDVRVRFNNWDRVRADLHFQAIFTAAYTAAAVLLLVGGLLLVPRLPVRQKQGQTAN